MNGVCVFNVIQCIKILSENNNVNFLLSRFCVILFQEHNKIMEVVKIG